MLEFFFNKIVGLKACNFIKKKLQHCEIFKSICSKEHLRTTASVYLKSKLSILRFTKYFLTSSAVQTLVLPNLYLLLRLSCLLNISNVSYSNSLNRLNGLSPYQKFVPMREVMLYFVKLCSRDNTASQHH